MWEKVKLRDISNTSSGGTPSRTKSEYFKDGDIPWILSGDLNKNEIIESKHYITDLGLKNSSAKIFPKKSILIAMYGATIGNASILRIEAATNQAICCIFPNPKYNSKFLYYYFKKAQNDLIQLGMGNAQPNISQSIINEIEIPLPPLPIQEKIADILDKADELRRKDKDLQTKYDELAQAIFIDMFGDPIRNEKGWEMKKLEEICSKITDGTHHSPANTLSGRKYITAKHIKNGKLDFFKNETYVSEEDHINIYSRCNPEYGDVLYIKDGATTGMAAVNNLQEEFSMLSSLALFKLKKELINNNYLVYYLNSSIIKDNLIREYMAGAAIKRFTLQKIKKFNIVLPPIHLQEEFAKKIEIINKLKKQTNIEKSEELFQSLLQKAFKGELVS